MLNGTGTKSVRKISELALLGDSITDQNSDTQYYYSMGYAVRGLGKLGWPFTTEPRIVSAYTGVPDWTHGYGSYSPQNILNGNRNGDGVYPMQDITAADPDDVFVHIGSNTGSGDDTSSILQIWDTLRADGRRVFAAEILPRVNGAFGYNSAALAQCYATNANLKVAAQSRGIPFLEWASQITLGANDFADPIYFQDGVHPNNLGAQKLGASFASFISPFAGLPFSIPALGSPLWLTSNPYVTGNVSGLATGYTTSGATTTKSKVIDGDGTEWQRLTCSQSPNYASWTLRQSSGAGTFPAGDVVRVIAKVRGVSSGWDYKNVQVALYSTISGTTAIRIAGNFASNTFISTLSKVDQAEEALLLSPPYTIPSNTTAMFSYLQGFGSGSVDIRQIGVIKVG